MDPLLPPLRHDWSEECEAERNVTEVRVEPQATIPANIFNRIVEFNEEDVYKPQPEIPGLVLPGIERRRSSKKKRSTAQMVEIAEKARDLNGFQSCYVYRVSHLLVDLG